LAREADEKEFEASVRENVNLAPMTTLEVGGPARFFADVRSSQQMLAGIRWAAARGIPVFVLGGGSNIVVSDRGFAGLVLRNAISGIEMHAGTGGSNLVTAGAGEPWDDVVKLAVANNLAGIECLSGIPGSVGATPIQNVGAYGQEISETMVRLAALDTRTGATVIIDSSECGFGYRTSRFKIADTGRFVITSVTYALQLNTEPATRYAELQHYLSERVPGRPALADVRDAVLAIRKAKAMVIDRADPDSRSVGSFFVNPLVTPEKLGEIERGLLGHSSTPAKIPAFPAPRGMIKLSAAWLIEQSGFSKGYAHGRAGLSSKHSLAIVARDGGTASEVLELAYKIQQQVEARFGVSLVPEPTYVGFE
jgi:UDP-N-acetylmuramate dehydrogenase